MRQRSHAGTVLERYEYDAYGNCYVLEPNFAPDPDGKSDHNNPYLFTGRRVDILDSGSLKIQYNRNRYYDYYTGRWLTHDPLGITPTGGARNPFSIPRQYTDDLSLYEYASSKPVTSLDAFGTCSRPVGDPWLSRRYFRTYRYTVWTPIFIGGILITNLPSRRMAWVSWQYKYSKDIDIAIAAGADVGVLIPKAIAITGWEWPSDKTKDIPGMGKKNYACRIWADCHTDCCSGNKTWTRNWRPLGPGRLFKVIPIMERQFVYGVIRRFVPPPGFGAIPPAAPFIGLTCVPFNTWDWWTTKLCTKKDQEKECAKKK